MKITVQQYAKTLLELTDRKTEQAVSDVVKKFAEVLKKDGQIKNAGKIMEKFSEIYNAKHGIVEANVISSRELSRDKIQQVENFIKEKYSAKEVIVKNIVDEKIKGGIIIKVGDEVLDGSVGGQLKRLRKNLVS
ncbi:MAG TPA: ATP synthase F1 subunit delta [Candidatus Moranbacteria bacterium]|nr:ATP synthase F1 subunit delta [Candidatus Moranbacteria bacterium]HRY27942.1 ATP synthase F1 subunit delta [Candidatus Moranbacteria bacterium]HSA08243.1 ATP synthase F1 subunit delta [Candidatus Moranbacteria bacterium]